MEKSEMQFSEAELIRLLERSPAVAVPADFAANVRGKLPETRPRTAKVPASRVVAWVCAVVIAAILFVIAPHAQASAQSFVFWMEMMLLVELGGIAWWLTARRTL